MKYISVKGGIWDFDVLSTHPKTSSKWQLGSMDWAWTSTAEDVIAMVRGNLDRCIHSIDVNSTAFVLTRNAIRYKHGPGEPWPDDVHMWTYNAHNIAIRHCDHRTMQVTSLVLFKGQDKETLKVCEQRSEDRISQIEPVLSLLAEVWSI